MSKLRSISTGKPIRSQTSDSSLDKVPSLIVEFLPETIPDNGEAWEKFTEEFIYKSLYDDYKMNENHLRETYTDYLDQIKKLQEIRDVVEERRADLTEVSLK